MNPDGYEILAELFRHGMTVAYRARQQEGAAVTLQFFPYADLSVAATAEHHRQRDRLNALALLDHPHILPVCCVGRYDNGCFLVRPPVSGTSFTSHLRRQGSIPPRQAARWALQLARAVEHAHEHGIVGCDLASSYLLYEGGEVLLHSFDTAHIRFLHPPIPPDESPSLLVGIPVTMSPEMVTGQAKRGDPRGDVWALGSLLYEMLTGDVPFRGANLSDTMYQIAITEFVRPRALRPEIEPALDRICVTCLQKNRDRRYPNMASVIEALSAYLENRLLPDEGDPPLTQRMGKWVRSWWKSETAT